jgi:hypothetical protein
MYTLHFNPEKEFQDIEAIMTINQRKPEPDVIELDEIPSAEIYFKR